MKILSKKDIIIRQNFGSSIFHSSLFLFVGICITLLPVIYFRKINMDMIVGVCFCFVCFGLPFGFFGGLRNLLRSLKRYKSLKTGKFFIYVDKVLDSRMLSQSIGNNTPDAYCQLEFEKYTEATNKCYTVMREIFNSTSYGDEFYLISLGDITESFSIFSRKTYELSSELKENTIN